MLPESGVLETLSYRQWCEVEIFLFVFHLRLPMSDQNRQIVHEKPLPAPPAYSESTVPTPPLRRTAYQEKAQESIQEEEILLDEQFEPGDFPDWPKEGSHISHHVQHSAWKGLIGVLDLIMVLLPLAFLSKHKLPVVL